MANSYGTWFSTTEQEILVGLDVYLEHVVGWYRVFTLSDTPTDRHYVYLSEGEENDGRPARLVAYDAVANNLNTDCLHIGEFDFLTGDYGSVYLGVSNNNRLSNISGGGRNRSVADKERVIVIVEINATDRFSLYTGRINSIYNAQDDPNPYMIRGQLFSADGWTGGLNIRALLSEDTETTHVILFHTAMTNEGYPNPRNGKFSFYNTLLYYNANVSFYEVRGQVRGVFYGKPDRIGNGSFVQIGDDFYLCHKTTNELDALLLGPVSQDGEIPQDIVQQGFPRSPYLKIDYTSRGLELESTTSGTLALWRFDTGNLDGYVYGSGSTLPVPTSYPDATGAYNLTPQSSLTSVESRLREAADFNGSSHYASASGDAAASGTLNGEWTFEMVFKPDTIPTGGNEVTLLSYGASGATEADNALLQVSITPAVGTTPDIYNVERGNIKVLWEHSAGTDVDNETAGDFVQQNRWNYLAIVKRLNGATYDLEVWHCSFGDYVSPSLKLSVSALAASSGGGDSSWFVGVDPALANYYNGQIDDTRVTERALTASEIASNCSRSMV